MTQTRTRHRIIDSETAGIPRERCLFNVNGPSVLRAPEWMPEPPGRYLLYFAHHTGASIRLAAADGMTGPWRVADADVLNVAAIPPGRHPHIASPDVHADHLRRRFVMYFHGDLPASAGAHLPCWGTYPTLNQKTLVAISATGRDFAPLQPVTAVAPSYLRMVEAEGAWHGVAMPSQLMRSPDGLRGFEYGPMLFDDDEIRHCCLAYHRVQRHLEMLFTRAYDAPERIYRTVIDTSGHWLDWAPGPVTESLRPTEAWEGADQPCEPVPRGVAPGPLNGLRDPCLLEDGDRGRWLFYATGGEDALAVTKMPAAQ